MAALLGWSLAMQKDEVGVACGATLIVWVHLEVVTQREAREMNILIIY